MNNLESKLAGALQGPMGSELRKLGITERLDEARHNECRRKVHELYRDAGAGIFVADTFGATPLRRHDTDKLSLQCHPDGKRFGPVYHGMNQRMVEIARDVAGEGVIVAGSIAPIVDTSGDHDPDWETFGSTERLGFLMDRQAPQLNALIGSGADMILGEAFRYVEEARAVATLAKEFGARGLAICFEANLSGVPYQEEGTPSTFRELKAELQQIAGNDIPVWVGANCTGMSVLKTIIESGDELDLVYANSLDFNGHQYDYGNYVRMKKAGRAEDQPQISAIEARRGTPDTAFAQFARFAFENGVKVVGGCCGTTPDTVRMIRSTWDDFNAR